MVEVDLQLIAVLAGTVIPLLVGLVTKLRASSTVKAWANALLSALSATSAVIIETGALYWRDVILTFGTTWVTSIATYYGLWKPTETSKVVQERTSEFGVGKAA